MASPISFGSVTTSGGTTRLSGTASELDTEALVQAIYDAKRIPAVRLENRITTNEAKIAAYGEMRTLLGNLQSAAESLRNPPGFLGAQDNVFENKQAFFTSSTTTDPNTLLGLGVDNNAPAGSFELVVNQLASANKLSSASTTSESETLADAWNGGGAFSGNIDIGLAGGSSVSIAIDGTMTLADLRSAIDAESATTGVGASILKVSDNDYRMVLTAQETGKAITVTDASGITGGFLTSELQAAQQAEFVVDGVTINRDSNQIDDVISGMTVDLFKAEPGTTVTVSVEPALGDAKAKIVEFVDAYNAFRAFADSQRNVDENGNVAEESVLFSERSLSGIVRQMSGIAGSAVEGLDPSALSTLRGVGIEIGADNQMSIDDSVLDNALLTNLDEVRAVFEFSFSASSSDLAVFDRTNALADNDFTVDIIDADSDGEPESVTIDGIAAEIDGSTIRGADGTAYEGLELIWTGAGSTSISVTANQGLADQFFNYLDDTLDPFDGVLTNAVEDLQGLNDDYGVRIDRIEQRASDERDRMIERFSAMEAALSIANAVIQQIRAQMDAMTADS